MYRRLQGRFRGVLLQDDRVISYESWKLKYSEKNYATHDLKLDAIIHSLRMWRHYLMGKKFLLKIDHASLKYLWEQPNLNVRKARWLALISEYDFDLIHLKGRENKVADTLSRRDHLLHEISLSNTEEKLKQESNIRGWMGANLCKFASGFVHNRLMRGARACLFH